MDHFIPEVEPEDGFDLLGKISDQAHQLVRAIIGYPAGDFLAGRLQYADRITSFEGALRGFDSDREERAAAGERIQIKEQV